MTITDLVRVRMRRWLLEETVDPLTVDKAVQLFIQDRIAQGRAERTLEDYQRVFKPFVSWCREQNVEMHEVTRESVRDYVVLLRTKPRPQSGKPWSKGTVGIHIRNLRTFLHWLRAEGKIPGDLASALKAPDITVRIDGLLTDPEIKQLFRVCRTKSFAERDWALLLTFLDTGLRLHEVVLMRRSQLQREQDHAWFHVYMPKTDRYRFAFLGQAATKALLQYLDTRTDEEDALWLGRRGPLTRLGIYKIVKRRAQQAGVHTYPHALRKIFSTRWMQNGGDKQDLQDIVGWIAPKMLEIYVQIAKRERLAAAHRQYSPVDRLLKTQ